MSIPFVRRSAEIADLDALIELRLIAMRPSLEKLDVSTPPVLANVLSKNSRPNIQSYCSIKSF